jgi:hypothetical protein
LSAQVNFASKRRALQSSSFGDDISTIFT